MSAFLRVFGRSGTSGGGDLKRRVLRVGSICEKNVLVSSLARKNKDRSTGK